jgi:RNA polymerase sigma factor (TIGR02999 family)
MSAIPREVTQLLQAWREGDESALEQLMPMVYDELRRIAQWFMRNERKGHTLQTSALINEAYLRLVERDGVDWQGRAHFFGVAAQAMRRVLVDYARARNYQKRAGQARQVSLDEAANIAEERAAEIVALDDALESLAGVDPRKCRVVELRYFGGLSVEETAEVLGVSVATVTRDWSMAKLWLLREINGEASDDA